MNTTGPPLRWVYSLHRTPISDFARERKSTYCIRIVVWFLIRDYCGARLLLLKPWLSAASLPLSRTPPRRSTRYPSFVFPRNHAFPFNHESTREYQVLIALSETLPLSPCSQVPTALLLERPLVMSSTLLDAYPCLRKSRVHSMVSD